MQQEKIEAIEKAVSEIGFSKAYALLEDAPIYQQFVFGLYLVTYGYHLECI